MLLEEFLGLSLHLAVALEGLDERLILSVAEFEVRVGFHFAQILFLLKEINCRLKSYIQFSNCFI